MADKGLKLGLRTEYEAVYAYSVAGPQLTGEAHETAKSNEKLHRDRRDDIMVRLAKSDEKAPAEEPGYALPTEVTDAKSAQKLISQIELRTTSMWRSVLADTSGGDREAAAKAYSSSAVTMARWKRALGESPSTTAFPGRTLCFADCPRLQNSTVWPVSPVVSRMRPYRVGNLSHSNHSAEAANLDIQR